MLDFFIERNTNLDIQDEWGATALMFCCQTPKLQKELEKLVLVGKVDVLIADREWNTALILACMKRNHAAAMFLVKNGADLLWKNINGKSALDFLPPPVTNLTSYLF